MSKPGLDHFISKMWIRVISVIVYVFIALLVVDTHRSSAYHVAPPPISRATKLPNQIYDWRGQKIRYQVAEPRNNTPDAPNLLLVHGLFVNSDHWRKALLGLSESGYRVYAIDMLGCGYSSKPPRDSPEAQMVCGERLRFSNKSDTTKIDAEAVKTVFKYTTSTLENVSLGTATGGTRIANVDLRHPLTSPYNFFTWADQIADFCKEVIPTEQTTLVCNSIGTISALQAAKDYPTLFNGVFVINPNFRELHTAEVPFPKLTMPFIRTIQSILRTRGHSLFDALAKPNTVAQILREPYRVHSAIDEELVDVLLSPLLTTGSADVVFDTLSYSAGPLPEQILADDNFPSIPVWVCYGKDDPWTPNARVERLASYCPPVERVVGFDKVGHCPHDEAPELVNPLLVEFLNRVHNTVPNMDCEKRDEEKTIMRRTLSNKPYFVS